MAEGAAGGIVVGLAARDALTGEVCAALCAGIVYARNRFRGGPAGGCASSHSADRGGSLCHGRGRLGIPVLGIPVLGIPVLGIPARGLSRNSNYDCGTVIRHLFANPDVVWATADQVVVELRLEQSGDNPVMSGYASTMTTHRRLTAIFGSDAVLLSPSRSWRRWLAGDARLGAN
jgi:hypothetical protein